MKKGLILTLISASMLLAACGDENNKVEENVSGENKPALTKEEQIQKAKDLGVEFEKKAKKESEKVSKTEVRSDVPDEYNKALQEAQAYVDLMAFSEKTLDDQLTSAFGGKFTDKAAEYALANIKVNYEEEALETAIKYREANQKLSDQALIDQLMLDYGDKFTSEEAHYAINNLPADLVIPSPTFDD